MIRDERGSMSAFLAMLFLVFLLLISVCVEGIYMYTARGKAIGIYMSGLSHTKGNYQKELAEMYHIYAMDPRYRKKIETDFSNRMKESLDMVSDSFKFQTGSTIISDDINVTEQRGEVLKYQIRQQMKYESFSDVINEWMSKVKTNTEQRQQMTDIKDQISREEEEAKKEEKTKEDNTDNEKIPQTGTSEVKDPRKGFMKLLKEGSVSLVMGKRKVSNLPIHIVYSKKDTTKQKLWNFMDRKAMEKEIDELKESPSADSLTSELPVMLYAEKYFHYLTDSSKKEGTKYEIEYLISGKDSERENLSQVLWKMIALRFLTNASCVYKDPAKQKEAMLLATSILGITGLPPVVSVAKNLLLLALAYGESVIDVRNLSEGKKVPVLKTPSNWQLSFSQLATLNCKRKPVKDGMEYKDYLILLLILQKDKRLKYFRMMDLIEGNVKRKVVEFKLDQCISSYKITQNVKLRKLGFGGLTLPFAPYTDFYMSRFTTY